MVMKEVKIAELKAHLSEHLRAVRRGHSVTVLDREQPIARIIPYAGGAVPLRIRKPARGTRRPADVPLRPPLRATTNAVALLLEDRESGR